MSFANSLPRPARLWEKESKIQIDAMNKGADILNDPNKFCPSYGNRRNWIPRSDSDFGDGGAYPEVHVAQYPLDMGAVVERKNNEKTLTVKLSESGNIKYDSIAKNGHGSNKIVYTNIIQLLPGETLPKNDELKKPNIETLTETTEMTRRALEKLTSQKINAAMPCRQAASSNVTQYLRYTPLQQGDEFNSGAKQRVIKMVEAQVDPMEPPKFKINKKIPRGPPSPPAPVLHSPSRKVSMKEQKEWKVPPCISNWKNAKGYTIPLDKRLAADGRGLQQLHINEKFAKMAEALYIADRKAREAVEARAQLEKKLAQKEKEKKEDMLRVMAQKARDERAGLRFSDDVESNEIRERDELRAERHKDRMREKNLSRAAPDKRLKLQRERERDITEQIALGKSAKLSANSESQFDQRLFNTTKGMDSGYGDDEGYNVYDKPWRDSASLSTHLHRPKKDVDNEIYGTDYTKLNITNKFVPDKEFLGAERSAQSQRNGPVQFEKEDDPFGLDQFLNMAKKATKRSEGVEDKVSENKRQKH